MSLSRCTRKQAVEDPFSPSSWAVVVVTCCRFVRVLTYPVAHSVDDVMIVIRGVWDCRRNPLQQTCLLISMEALRTCRKRTSVSFYHRACRVVSLAPQRPSQQRKAHSGLLLLPLRLSLVSSLRDWVRDLSLVGGWMAASCPLVQIRIPSLRLGMGCGHAFEADWYSSPSL